MPDLFIKSYPNSYDVVKDPLVDPVLAEQFSLEYRPSQGTYHVVAFESRVDSEAHEAALHAVAGLVTVIRRDDLLRIASVITTGKGLQPEVSNALIDKAERFAHLAVSGIIAKPQDVPDVIPELESRGFKLIDGPLDSPVFYKKTG